MCRLRCLSVILICVLLTGGVLAQSAKPVAVRAVKKNRLPAVPEIEKAFRASSEDPRISLFQKLQRVGLNADQPEIVDALTTGLLDRIEKQSFDPVDMQLEVLLGQFPSVHATESLAKFLAVDDPRAVIIALRSIANSVRPSSWDQVLDVSKRADYEQIFGLRRGVVQVAERNGSREAIDFLIETLSKVDGQLKYEAARSLTVLTGEKFGGQPDQWAAWWRTARDDFPVAGRRDRMNSSLRTKMKWQEPIPEFYQLPVYAYRVLFIIDQSGSMNMIEGEESRMDRARRELENAITGLSPDSSFSVLSFNDFVTPFSPRLLPANENSKMNAILFSRNLTAMHSTNCYDALTLALNADPNLEAIYFLSDGEPTSGGIVDPPSIVEAISLQNQLRMTSIYTLGIGAYGAHEDFLKKLAERNFGEFFPIQ